jgi:FKBP-type peptidyl-prolyl cis-trans isomerase 2
MSSKKGKKVSTGKSRKTTKSTKTISKKTVLKKNDFVYIDYIGIVKETNEVFDTTIKEEAEKAGIYREEETYEPMLVVVGEGWVVEGLDEALIGKSEGKFFEVEVPPEKGFGRRDSKKIVTTTLRKLRRGGLEGDVRPGMVIQVNGVPAVVKAVVSGRVMLDFNPPLAGKNLIYKVWIREALKTDIDKVKALVKKHSREMSASAKITIKNKIVEIKLGSLTIDNPQVGYAKKKIVDDILKYIHSIDKVRFVEEAVRSEEASQETAKTKEAQPQQG